MSVEIDRNKGERQSEVAEVNREKAVKQGFVLTDNRFQSCEDSKRRKGLRRPSH